MITNYVHPMYFYLDEIFSISSTSGGLSSQHICFAEGFIISANLDDAVLGLWSDFLEKVQNFGILFHEKLEKVTFHMKLVSIFALKLQGSNPPKSCIVTS